MSSILIAAALIAAGGGPAASGAASARQITLVMRDDSFTPAAITLAAGVPVKLRLVNEGTRDHEFQVYPVPRTPPADWNTYVMSHSYFKNMGEIDVALPGRAEIGTTALFKVHVAPGATVVLWFTPRSKGRFQMASHDPGRSETGLVGSVVVQ